jgi:hypothetical protein
MKLISSAIIALIIITTYGCQTNPTRTSGSVEIGNENARVEVIFSDHDRKLIHEHYKYGKQKKVPPGLAKKTHLPPGHEKHYKKHGRLPPGLEGRYLPNDLEHRLERLPKEYVRIRVGTDILLMEKSTRLILDVITGVAY